MSNLILNKDNRLTIVNQLSTMANEKFISLPCDYRETIYFAMDKMANLQDIEKVQIQDVSKAFIKMFRNDLDFTKNHCYFFVQNDRNSKTGKSLRFGMQYQGKIHIVKSKLNVKEVMPILVHKEDDFEPIYENGELTVKKHIPTFSGEIIGGYCVVTYNDNSKLVKFYTKKELDMRRNASQAPEGNFWKWEREMYEKTLINATLDRIIETSPDTVVKDLLYENEPQKQTKNQFYEDAKVIDPFANVEEKKQIIKESPKKDEPTDAEIEVLRNEVLNENDNKLNL